ncbi:hypothetical protein Y1Q_0004068 [Alligator mississippiensis]|uniref:Uncharacterized protein n=1 Tax=Alligator mississippiensis TaxID=8496 RepID=A0A151PHU7_ALLMI|nr:hypothetical protein Y1Q_0004068 [Alligator mississippiensis]
MFSRNSIECSRTIHELSCVQINELRTWGENIIIVVIIKSKPSLPNGTIFSGHLPYICKNTFLLNILDTTAEGSFLPYPFPSLFLMRSLKFIDECM